MMKILIIGVGLLGYRVAERLTGNRHVVIGTTTTPAKVERLQGVCDSVEVLTGDDRTRIQELGAECDGIVVTVSPRFSRTGTPQEREVEYKRTFVNTCLNASQAHERCVFSSSFSVYGDGGLEEGAITEESLLSASQEPSTKYYRMAEELVLSTGRGAVLRFPDMYGGVDDLSYAERVKLAVEMMSGRVPFSANALFYRLHYDDAANAIVHSLEQDLTGVFNVCDDVVVPPTNQAVFDGLTDAAGLPRLLCLGQIKLPARPVSSAKFRQTGFDYQFTDYVFE